VRTANIVAKIAANEERVVALNAKIDELVLKRDAVIEETDRLKTAAILAAAQKRGIGFNDVISAIEHEGLNSALVSTVYNPPVSNDTDPDL
jgi:hypothetical protein